MSTKIDFAGGIPRPGQNVSIGFWVKDRLALSSTRDLTSVAF